MAAGVLFQQITECLNGPEEIPSLPAIRRFFRARLTR
jgi:hypothetical protein